MTTPLIILALLGSPFLVSRIWGKATGNPIDVKTAGVVGLALAFAFFASGHFIQAEPLAAMLPPALVIIIFQRMFIKGLVEQEK